MRAAADESQWTGLRGRDRWLVLVVPLVLVLIATLAVWRYHDLRQSSWQGVGFGMFATYDNGVSRVVRVTIEQDGELTRVDPSAAFGDLVERSEVVPLGPAPGELADRVRQRTDAERVVVEVWAIDVESLRDGLRVEIGPIRSVTSR